MKRLKIFWCCRDEAAASLIASRSKCNEESAKIAFSLVVGRAGSGPRRFSLQTSELKGYSASAASVPRSHTRQVDFSLGRIHPAPTLETATTTAEPLLPGRCAPSPLSLPLRPASCSHRNRFAHRLRPRRASSASTPSMSKAGNRRFWSRPPASRCWLILAGQETTAAMPSVFLLPCAMLASNASTMF